MKVTRQRRNNPPTLGAESVGKQSARPHQKHQSPSNEAGHWVLKNYCQYDPNTDDWKAHVENRQSAATSLLGRATLPQNFEFVIEEMSMTESLKS
jgi:hypothetical protein